MMKLIVLLGLVAWIWRTYVVRITRTATRRHTIEPALGRMERAAPHIHFSGRRAGHGVLLLHGYSATPEEYVDLWPLLDQSKVTNYAPRLFGFGLDRLDPLTQVDYKDWLLSAIEAFDVLSARCERVSIVGHSNGACLALQIQELREVENLVLVGPNVLPSPADAAYKPWILHPVGGRIMRLISPYFIKPFREGRVSNTDTREPLAASKALNYPTLPTRSLQALWKLQDAVQSTRDCGAARGRPTPTLLALGAHDASVDGQRTEQWLRDRGFDVQTYMSPDSGHNVMEDYGKEEANQAIVDFLREN